MKKNREQKLRRKVRRYLKSQRDPVTRANICSSLLPLQPTQVQRALDAMTGDSEVVVYGSYGFGGEEVISYALRGSQADWLPKLGNPQP